MATPINQIPIVFGSTINDLADYDTWQLTRIRNRTLPLITDTKMAMLTSTAPVEIIVMDSGINKNHAEFDGVNISDLYFIPGFGNTNDDIGHGTAVASMIAGVNVGVNSHATLKIVKIMGANYQTTTGDILNAFDAIYEYHQTCLDVTKIVNMSWQVPFNDAINDKLQTLSDAGIILISATGNNGEVLDTMTPVGYHGVIAVAGSTRNDEALSPVYGENKKITLFAPSDKIAVANYMDNTSYGIMSGSSLGAGLTSGVASLIVGLYETPPTPDDVDYAMRADSTPNALVIGEQVSFMENRLLHRPESVDIYMAADLYAGNLVVGSGQGLTFSLAHVLNDQMFKTGPDGNLNYSITWDTIEGQNLFGYIPAITDTITLNPIDVMDDITDEVKQFSFHISASNSNIVMTSPKIHFFVSSINVPNSEIYKLAQAQNLEPLSIIGLANIK